MAAKALGVLAHVAALGTRLRRWDQAGEYSLVASNWSLDNCLTQTTLKTFFFFLKKKWFKNVKATLNYLCGISHNWGVVGGVADRRHSHSLRINNHSQRTESTY